MGKDLLIFISRIILDVFHSSSASSSSARGGGGVYKCLLSTLLSCLPAPPTDCGWGPGPSSPIAESTSIFISDCGDFVLLKVFSFFFCLQTCVKEKLSFLSTDLCE